MGPRQAREPEGSHWAHPQLLAAAAAEPRPEGKLEVTFTQSYIFPALQILQSGCNRDICSWTEKLSGDWLGEGRKEAEGRKESGSSPGQGKGAATFWKSIYSPTFTLRPVTN